MLGMPYAARKMLSQMPGITYAVPEVSIALGCRKIFSFMLRPGKNRRILWQIIYEKLHVAQKTKTLKRM